MALYGYARVSVREPEDKNLDSQVKRLRIASKKRYFQEVIAPNKMLPKIRGHWRSRRHEQGTKP